jgi:hypothetical protein
MSIAVMTLSLAGGLFAAEVWLLLFRPNISGKAAFQWADLPPTGAASPRREIHRSENPPNEIST